MSSKRTSGKELKGRSARSMFYRRVKEKKKIRKDWN